jgi:hypothetical protein
MACNGLAAKRFLTLKRRKNAFSSIDTNNSQKNNNINKKKKIRKKKKII